MFCAVNPMANVTSELKDGIVPKAPASKKVAVVGGGPGGIQAMETLLDRGHDVTLYEKSGSLGGNIIRAAEPPFKVDMQDYLKWLCRNAAKCASRGARILLNTEATKDILNIENYDALVLAVGADPLIPDNIPGVDRPNVFWAPDVDREPSKVGNKVAVIGGGGVGFESALVCSDLGKDVTLVEMLDEANAIVKLNSSAGNVSREFLKIVAERDIPIKYDTALIEIKAGCIVTKNMLTGELSELQCDTILLAMGMKERLNVVEELRRCAPETNVHIIGDCRKAATISEAINQAFQACFHI